MRLQHTNTQHANIQIHYGGAFLRLVQRMFINYSTQTFFSVHNYRRFSDHHVNTFRTNLLSHTLINVRFRFCSAHTLVGIVKIP